MVAEVRQAQVAQQQAAVGVRVGAHPALALGHEREHVGPRTAVLVEQLLGPVGAHPGLELARRARATLASPVSGTWCERGVASPGPGPALRRAQHDHRPARALPAAAGCSADLAGDLVERGRHRLVHRLGVVALDEPRAVAVAGHQRVELVVRDPAQHRRVRDLVAVELQDRQHGAVARRVEELVRVPARRQRAGLGLAVADHARREQVGVVEHRAVRVGERVAELAALVDRAGRLGRDVARDAARERELAEQPPHALRVTRDVGVDLAVGALEPRARDEARAAVAGAGDVDRAQVVLADRAVEVRVDEVQPGRRAPVAEQPRLDVLRLAAARAGAGCRAGRSARRTGSSRRARTRRAARVPRCGHARECRAERPDASHACTLGAASAAALAPHLESQRLGCAPAPRDPSPRERPQRQSRRIRARMEARAAWPASVRGARGRGFRSRARRWRRMLPVALAVVAVTCGGVDRRTAESRVGCVAATAVLAVRRRVRSAARSRAFDCRRRAAPAARRPLPRRAGRHARRRAPHDRAGAVAGRRSREPRRGRHRARRQPPARTAAPVPLRGALLARRHRSRTSPSPSAARDA